MLHRNQQIVKKLLSEITELDNLIAGYDLTHFLSDERTKRAVCMTLINIGKLIKTLTPDFRFAHSDIPWKVIAGLRDITAHKYQTLRMEDIWETVTVDVPPFQKQLNELLN